MKVYFTFIGIIISLGGFAQTGIGTTTPHASAKLDVTSTDKGFLPPRMTALQRTGIGSPAAGLMVYQTDDISGLYYFNGTSWIYIINSTTNVVSVLNGGTGTTTATGSGSVVLSNSPSLSLPTITSGSGQFPNSLTISPTTHATSKRSAIWLDGWSLLQDIQGDGTKNFSIGETISGPQYPPRLVIAQGNGNIGFGTSNPTARLNLVGGGIKIHNGFSNNATRPSLTTTAIGNFEIRGVGSVEGSTQVDASNDGFLRLSAGGGTATTTQSSIDLSGFSNQADMNNNIVMRTAGVERVRIDNSGTTTFTGNLNGTSNSSTLTNFGTVLNDQTVTSYTLATSDNGKIVTFNSSNPITLTVPSLSVGFNCMVIQKGTGQVTLSAASGVTVSNRYGFTKTAGQFSSLTLVCISSNTFISSGDMNN